MTQHSAVQFLRSGNAAEIVIDREQNLNALNSEVLTNLSSILEGLTRALTDRSPDSMYSGTRVVTVRGAGEKAFVAGADIKFMHSASNEDLRRFIELGEHVMRQIELVPIPVIAFVDGFAIGGGMELALACDVILATERARFGQAEVNLGIIPGFGGTQRLIRRSGVGTAKRLIFSGETISAEEAYRLRIVDILVSSASASVERDRLVATYLSRGPLAIAAAKRAIEAGESGGKVLGLEVEREEFVRVFQTQDAAEGLRAFSEKRQPQFKGQ